jgi:hypothetical protein
MHCQCIEALVMTRRDRWPTERPSHHLTSAVGSFIVWRSSSPSSPPASESPSEVPIRVPADLERNPDGFNGSQSIGLQCPNKRHRPCSLFLIHHHAAQPVQIPGQSFLAWKPSGRLPTARNQTRFATFLAAVETSLSEANASLPPDTGPLATYY